MLDDPHAFDALLGDASRSLAELPGFPSGDLGKLRRVQVLFAHDLQAPIDQLHELLTQVHSAPSRGIGLRIQVEEGLYEEVLAVNPDPTGYSPLELEDACHAHSAVATAAAQLGQHHRALQHLRSALTLSKALGMHFRTQSIALEWLRIRNLTGDPAPEEIEIILMQPMSSHCRQWAQRTRSASLMSLGAYADALRALGARGSDSSEDAELREYLHVILGLPPARDPADPLLVNNQGFYALALALRALNAGAPSIDVKNIQGQPQETYARLLEAASLVRTPKMMGAALRSIGESPPAAADLALTWGLIRVGIMVENNLWAEAWQAMQVVERSFARLRSPHEFVRAIAFQSARMLALLLVSPFNQGLSGLSSLSLLTGQVVIHQGESVRLPGRTGRTVVLEAADCEGAGQLNRTERKRLSEALVAFGGSRVVNLGWVAKACGGLRLGAHLTGDAGQAAAWGASYDRVFEMLSDDVQAVFAQFPPDYVR